MRIGIDATSIPLKRVGTGNYIFNLVNALAEIDNHNTYFIFVNSRSLGSWEINKENFHVIRINFFGQTSLRLLWEQTGLPLQIRKLKIDVLHSPHYTMPIAKPCKSVVTFCDMTFQLFPEKHELAKRIIFPKMMRLSSHYAEKLIAISESTRQDVIRLLKVSPDKIISIPLAATSDYRVIQANQVKDVCDRYNLIPHKYIYYVGTLEPRKNVPLLIEAYSKLPSEFHNIPLVIAGKKGWLYEKIFEIVKILNLEERVHFLGYVPDEDLIALYNGTRVCVYPSLYEGFGLPVLESMQCGAPVITTNVSSMPEVAGNAALLVTPNDPEGLSKALWRVLTDDKLANDLSTLGLARSSNFSWIKCAKETLQVYESLMKTF